MSRTGRVIRQIGNSGSSGGGGGGGGATVLDDLTDVTIAAAALGDILRHDGTQWVDAAGTSFFEVAGAITAHLAALDPHTQYALDSEKGAASGIATLDGTTKVPAAQLGSGTPDGTKFLRDDRSWQNPSLDNLSDVAITTPASGHIVRHNGTQFVNVDGTTVYEVAGAVSAHVAAGDPHTQYALDSEKGAASGIATLDGTTKVPVAQLGTGTPDGTKFLRDDRSFQNPSLDNLSDVAVTTPATGHIIRHNGTQFVNVDGSTIYEAAGAVAAHVALADPHTQYVLDSEKGATSGVATLDGSTLVPTAQQGTGTANSTKYLRGDRTWTTLDTAAVSGLGTAATRNVPAAGNASSTEVVKGDDTRLTDSRTPTAHKTSHESGGSDALSGNLDATARVAVRKNTGGANVGARRRLNFIEGSNVTLTLADSSVNEEVTVTIAASVTGGSGISLGLAQVVVQGATAFYF